MKQTKPTEDYTLEELKDIKAKAALKLLEVKGIKPELTEREKIIKDIQKISKQIKEEKTKKVKGFGKAIGKGFLNLGQFLEPLFVGEEEKKKGKK